MNKTLRKILVVFIVAIVAFGSYVTTCGLGSFDSIKDLMKFGLDINGGVYVVLEADEEDIAGLSNEELVGVMDQTRAVLNNRVNAMGLAEATVSIEGSNRIRVEMPGVEDAQEAIETIGQTAQLSFVLADGTVALTGDYVKDASIDTDPNNGGYKINLEFTADGKDLFAEATRLAYDVAFGL